MRAARRSLIQSLRRLTNISWLKPRQLNEVADALMVSRVAKRGIIFDEKVSSESAFILLSGAARITCGNRKGDRVLVMMVAPGLIPGLPPAVSGISHNFRCEAATACQIGTVTLAAFIEIALGVAAADFKRVAASYSEQWDRVQLRSSNFMGYRLEERVALILIELSGSFGVRDRQGVGLMMALRHQDLADLVGASRPRVTEYLASFEGKRLLARDGRRLIVRRGRLERFLARRD